MEELKLAEPGRLNFFKSTLKPGRDQTYKMEVLR
jgi:hypothetical protein